MLHVLPHVSLRFYHPNNVWWPRGRGGGNGGVVVVAAAAAKVITLMLRVGKWGTHVLAIQL